MIQQILNIIRKWLGVHSPSKEWVYITRQLKEEESEE